MNRFNVSVMVNGEERSIGKDNAVELPFGVEYALKLTNNHPKLRAVCKLFIDDKEQSINGYCIQRGGSVIIERNSHTPNKFLFVSQASKASISAGHDPENKEKTNGIVECRFYLEKEPKYPLYEYPVPMNDGARLGSPKSYSMLAGGAAGLESFGPRGSSGAIGRNGCQGSQGATPAAAVLCSVPMELNESAPTKSFNVSDTLKRCRTVTQTVKPGVTVAGGHSNKVYQKVNIDLEDQFVTLKFALRGSDE